MTYFNDQGEPLMTAAQARFEADLDADAYHGSDDLPRFAHDEDFYYDNPHLCPHDDVTYKGTGTAGVTAGDVFCDQCANVVGRWEGFDGDGWAIRV